MQEDGDGVVVDGGLDCIGRRELIAHAMITPWMKVILATSMERSPRQRRMRVGMRSRATESSTVTTVWLTIIIIRSVSLLASQ